MATTCAKEATVEEGKQIVKTATEYGNKAEQFTKEIVQSVSTGELTPREAKLEVVSKYMADPRTFKALVQSIENASRSGRTVESAKTSMGIRDGSGKSITVTYTDGTQETYKSVSIPFAGNRGVLVAEKDSRPILSAGERTYKASDDRQAVLDAIRSQRKSTEEYRDSRRDESGNIPQSQREIHGRAMQGNIGEQIAFQVAEDVLGLNAMSYDKTSERGLDGLYRGPDGQIVVMESKCSMDAYGRGDLATTKDGKEASIEWSLAKARDMQTPGSEYYTRHNAEVGKAIEQAHEQGKLSRVLIHTHAQSLNTVVSMGNGGDWTPSLLLEPNMDLED